MRETKNIVRLIYGVDSRMPQECIISRQTWRCVVVENELRQGALGGINRLCQSRGGAYYGLLLEDRDPTRSSACSGESGELQKGRELQA